MNAYQKDLFDIEQLLSTNYDSLDEAKRAIKPIFLKLNNPTFYKKHVYSKPTEQFGFADSNNYSNNILTKYTTECIKIINESQDLFEMLKKLQIEYSWTTTNNLSYWMKNA
jgi:hypothetical protein